MTGCFRFLRIPFLAIPAPYSTCRKFLLYYAPLFLIQRGVSTYKPLFSNWLQLTLEDILIYINQRNYPEDGKIYGGKFDCSKVVVKSEPADYLDRAEAAGPRDPQSIEDAIALFSDPDYCLKYLAFRRWPDGRVRCPECGSANVAWLAGRRIWECRARHAHAQFSVRSGTFLEDSRVSLCQWLTALWLMAEHNRGISSYEIARRIGVTQKSAWLMMKRVRRALGVSGLSLDQFSGDRISGDRVSGQSLANGV